MGKFGLLSFCFFVIIGAVNNLRKSVMGKHNLSAGFPQSWDLLLVVSVIAAIILGGCVERKLTINTEPQEALVVLNDEEIGQSPVTVSFEWYGDYNVTIRKEGYETLKTHRKLKGPWYDRFPFDFFAGVLSPKRIVDSYEWTFTLAPQEYPTREELIQNAEGLRKQL
jgi:hypothetical protein